MVHGVGRGHVGLQFGGVFPYRGRASVNENMLGLTPWQQRQVLNDEQFQGKYGKRFFPGEIPELLTLENNYRAMDKRALNTFA
jgi:hypothetical protein